MIFIKGEEWYGITKFLLPSEILSTSSESKQKSFLPFLLGIWYLHNLSLCWEFYIQNTNKFKRFQLSPLLLTVTFLLHNECQKVSSSVRSGVSRCVFVVPTNLPSPSLLFYTRFQKYQQRHPSLLVLSHSFEY